MIILLLCNVVAIEFKTTGSFSMGIVYWEFYYDRIHIFECVFYRVNDSPCIYLDYSKEEVEIFIGDSKFLVCKYPEATGGIVIKGPKVILSINRSCFQNIQGSDPSCMKLYTHSFFFNNSVVHNVQYNTSVYVLRSNSTFHRFDTLNFTRLAGDGIFCYDNSVLNYQFCSFSFHIADSTGIFECRNVSGLIIHSNFQNITCNSIVYDVFLTNFQFERNIIIDSRILHFSNTGIIDFSNCFTNINISDHLGLGLSPDAKPHIIKVMDCIEFSITRTQFHNNTENTRIVEKDNVRRCDIINCFFGSLKDDESGGAIRIYNYNMYLSIISCSFLSCSSFSNIKLNLGGAICCQIYFGTVLLKHICSINCSSNRAICLHSYIISGTTYINESSIVQCSYSSDVISDVSTEIYTTAYVQLNSSKSWAFSGSFIFLESNKSEIQFSYVCECSSHHSIMLCKKVFLFHVNFINNSNTIEHECLLENFGGYYNCIFSHNSSPMFPTTGEVIMMNSCIFDIKPTSSNLIFYDSNETQSPKPHPNEVHFLNALCFTPYHPPIDKKTPTWMYLAGLLVIVSIILSYYYLNFSTLHKKFVEQHVLTKQVLDDFG